ncbi:hypothetical protein BAZSYMA_ACONTIG06588_4 [Bathymodiolus azoricus thioautotrophic gill symbiont]|uniref:Uncharacterized protein n=1 Tax=Bathymodiolus azoricus thioautotrophic gill symbiont TaxID=235205 RepID=A0A1H6KUB7_9GAMM|nr:hypothetical protein BAZSYMA_ACONTIG06588_4 [Bathymodiolus azoricus thioautotrophic gill symbiont]
MITKPPMPAAMSDKSIAVLSFLPNTTYDLPTPYFLIECKSPVLAK